MSRLGLILIATLILVTSAQFTYAAKPYHQSFNDVAVIPFRNTVTIGGIAAGSPTVDGLAVLPEVMEGFSVARGSADYDALKLYIKMEGQTADLRGTAISNQILNISDPNVLPGTAGTMYLQYEYGGLVAIDGDVGNSVTYGLSVTKDIGPGGTGGTLLDMGSREIAPPISLGNTFNSTLNVDVPFVYGEEFSLTTRFDVILRSDQEYFFSPPASFILDPATTYQSILADFENSATLEAVFIPEGASLALNSASGFDFTPVLNFGQPVPVPSALLLFTPAVLLLGRFKLQRHKG